MPENHSSMSAYC